MATASQSAGDGLERPPACARQAEPGPVGRPLAGPRAERERRARARGRRPRRRERARCARGRGARAARPRPGRPGGPPRSGWRRARRRRGRRAACPARARPRETTGTAQPATARTTRSSLNGRRSSKLPPPRVSTIDVDSGLRGQLGERRRDRAPAPRGPWTYVSATSDPSRPESAPSTAVTKSRLAAASLPVSRPIRRGRAAAGACARRRRALGGQLALQPLDPREDAPRPTRLDRERAQPEDAAGRVELGPPEDVDARRRRRARAAARRSRPRGMRHRQARAVRADP